MGALDPEPLRPLTEQRRGQAHTPCLPDRAALNSTYQDQNPITKSPGFRALPPITPVKDITWVLFAEP